MASRVSLVEMPEGRVGTAVEIKGGRGMIRRLDALGIRPGKRIEKSSGSFMRGPVTVRVGNAQVAIGFSMARRIIIELGVADN
jgi:ferrous iron transport protein A